MLLKRCFTHPSVWLGGLPSSRGEGRSRTARHPGSPPRFSSCPAPLYADGVDIAGGRFLQFEVFTPHAAEKLLISGFLMAQTEADALLDVVGGKENDSAFILQLVVHANEVMEHRLGQLVRLVEDQKRSVHLYHVVQDQAPDLTDIVPVRLDPDLLGDLTHEVTLLHVLGAKDVENLLVLFRVKARRRRLSHPASPTTHVTLRQRWASSST